MRAIKIEENDNVAVVAQDTKRGDIVIIEKDEVQSINDIPVGHKIAIEDIKKGELVLKYSVPIGKAITDIKKGEHVHVNNVEDITEELCNQNKQIYINKGEEINS